MPKIQSQAEAEQENPAGPITAVRPDFEVSEQFAPVPEDQPHQQRALCMVKGRLLIVDAKKNQGLLQVEGHNYPCIFTGRLKAEKMSKRVNQELSFTAWPTGQIPARKEQAPLVLLQLHSLRKDVAQAKNGFCELRGFVRQAGKQHFQVHVHSEKTQETYAIGIDGKCSAKEGDFVRVHARLTPKGLKLLGCEQLDAAPTQA